MNGWPGRQPFSNFWHGHLRKESANKSAGTQPCSRGFVSPSFLEHPTFDYPGSREPPPQRPLASSRKVWRKQTLGAHLAELKGQDPNCVFIVRRLGSMGFQSDELLAEHYSRYGEVVEVLVPHSKAVRDRGARSQHLRIRPGSLGFVVMGSPEAARQALESGAEQDVGGHKVIVEAFRRVAKLQQQQGDLWCVCVCASEGGSRLEGLSVGSPGRGASGSAANRIFISRWRPVYRRLHAPGASVGEKRRSWSQADPIIGLLARAGALEARILVQLHTPSLESPLLMHLRITEP